MSLVTAPLRAEHHEVWLRMRRELLEDEAPDLIEEENRQILATGRLKNQPFHCLLALDDGRPVGMIEVTIRSSAEDCMTSPVGYVESWFVDTNARGRGVGRALMEAAFQLIRAEGCSEVGSDTRIENHVSAKAHQAVGFEDVGCIRCFRRSI